MIINDDKKSNEICECEWDTQREKERKKKEKQQQQQERKKEKRKGRKEGEKKLKSAATPLQRRCNVSKKRKWRAITNTNIISSSFSSSFFFFFFFEFQSFFFSRPERKFICLFHIFIWRYYFITAIIIYSFIYSFIYLFISVFFWVFQRQQNDSIALITDWFNLLWFRKKRERERKKRNTDITDEWININQSKYKRWFHWIFELLFDRVWSYSFCRRNENPERWKRHSFSCGCCCCCCYCCCCCSSSCSSKRTEKVGAFQRPCHRSPRIDLRCVHFFCLRRRVTAHESTNWVKLSLDQSDSESSRAPSGEHPVELNRVRTFRNSGRQALEPRVQLTPKWRLIDV